VLVIICSLSILAFVVGQTVMSVRLRRANTQVRAANVALSHSLYEVQWRQADDADTAGEHSEAIARFSHFLRENPNDATAAARLPSPRLASPFPAPLLPPLTNEAPVTAMDFSQAGDRLATVSAQGTVRLWSLTVAQAASPASKGGVSPPPDIALGGRVGKLDMELTYSAPLGSCILCGEKDLRLLTLSTEPKAQLWDLSARRLSSVKELGPINPHAFPSRG